MGGSRVSQVYGLLARFSCIPSRQLSESIGYHRVDKGGFDCNSKTIQDCGNLNTIRRVTTVIIYGAVLLTKHGYRLCWVQEGMLRDYVPDNGPCARINVFVLRKVFLTLPYNTGKLAVRHIVTHSHGIYGNLIHV